MHNDYKKVSVKGTSTKVAPLGLGCFPLGGYFKGAGDQYYAYGKIEKQTAIDTIRKAYELGINLFDTADVYGTGYSELFLGEAIKEFRDEVVIATKFSSTFVEFEREIAGGDKNTSEEYIRQAIDDSMRRLQTDFIEIYQLHSSSHDPEDALKVKLILEDLVSEGRIGGYGWSTDDPQRMDLFDNANSVQFILNVLYYNDDMLDLINKRGMIGLIRSPLASGTLTGKYRGNYKITDKTHMLANTDFNTDRRKIMNKKLDELEMIFQEDNYSLIQGQIAYIMAHGESIIPIPGAKNLDQITENAATLELKSLSVDKVRRVNELLKELQKCLVKDGKRDTRYLVHKNSK